MEQDHDHYAMQKQTLFHHIRYHIFFKLRLFLQNNTEHVTPNTDLMERISDCDNHSD